LSGLAGDEHFGGEKNAAIDAAFLSARRDACAGW
jgi:hypothetical protein